MVSLEAIASGMGYAVLALLLGVLVSPGFLLPGRRAQSAATNAYSGAGPTWSSLS